MIYLLVYIAIMIINNLSTEKGMPDTAFKGVIKYLERMTLVLFQPIFQIITEQERFTFA